MRILVVDDEVLALKILDIALREAGYNEVDFVQSSADALQYLENVKTPYDCLLLDIDMPGINGIELCRHARRMQAYSSVPIIMISALTNPKTIESALSAGATDYVSKPFNGLELGTRLWAAGLLSEATKKGQHDAHPSSWEMKSETSSGVMLSDGFSLDPLPGLLNQADFVSSMMEQDQLPKGVRVFSATIADVERVFSAVPSTEFRAIINEVAKSLVHIAHSWSPRITYSGDGVFWVALFNVGLLSVKGLHNILKASFATIVLDSLPSYRGDLRLCCQHVRTANREDFQCTNALRRLLQADRIAKGMALGRLESELTKELRVQFLGHGEAACLTRYEIVLPTTPPKHIQPKRVAPRKDNKTDCNNATDTRLAAETKR